MTLNKLFQNLKSIYCSAKKFFSFEDHAQIACVEFLVAYLQTMSDAEIEECKALLSQKGYKIGRKPAGLETIIYPPVTEEKMQLVKEVLSRKR